MEQIEDLALITKVLLGNEEAYTDLYERHYPFLFKYLLKLTVNEELSKDLAQETMLKAYLKLASYKGESQFSTWLISIASRQYLDHLRKRKREKAKLEHIKESLTRQLNWKADKQGICWSETFVDFNDLDANSKVPILLKHYYGYQYDEIAKMLQIREGTVKSRVHNGLKKIRKEWRNEDER
ncbi:RNA polymerase sigma factor SigY [Alkalihalobacillus alcalophilus ATCC 27647 = CGMCC 1.3604]|uniref:RNA polymerase sigma factor SigY n=1 Tax=Alkalihalobacillus alcalophilus ATCC 27647 = CGMCC 1.3604 TaxID=1218173 RepID=A0A094WIP0_ALKAL|nr:RNA polymerase sigma factor SigY [Alkalihalobacillus alcalophilus]KGA96696.1 RNA polymerase sigma factor SigY [Alkalihalobacillus alcalophilus ATCC 27647 = CGMCC 1.3604]MED1562372.1 RNA polymerase sigma factor SigY [Alkalihalobacillus alcalophilus]THG92003.1 RNA polymerase sigma factor SigY [Alkalihalobacillus alcalophilus ATCC 27647 = CGMCC 1.3604]